MHGSGSAACLPPPLNQIMALQDIGIVLTVSNQQDIQEQPLLTRPVLHLLQLVLPPGAGGVTRSALRASLLGGIAKSTDEKSTAGSIKSWEKA